MAERKTDYRGDTFGDWVVTDRAKAVDGRRYWMLVNKTNDEMCAVAQSLLAKGKVEPDLEHPYNAQRLPSAGDEGSQVPDNPFALKLDGVGPGECKHGIFINDCPECSARMGTPLSRQISNNVLAANAVWAEAKASVALDRDPEIGTYTLDELNPFSVPVEVIDSKVNGIGEAAEDAVSEAELDERVPVPDPIRALIRNLMGQVGELREQVNVLGAQSDHLQDLVDELLKEHVIR